MTQLDPKQFAVTVQAQAEITFQDMVAEQLRHSPWLALSAALHGIAILVLWILVPAEMPRSPQRHAEVVQSTTPDVEQPEPPKPVETVPEQPTDDVELTDVPLAENDNDLDVIDAETTETLSAFTSNQWCTSVGLSGGAAGPYSERGGGRRGGAPRSVVPVIERALVWLARHQDEDGKWDCDEFMKHDRGDDICTGAGNPVHDVGVTGLALLAFLGDNNTLRAGPYRDVVKKGVNWLRRQQQHNGLFGTDTSHDFIYGHAIATYAICEAYGLSRYRMLRPVAQKAINYLESHRNPYGVWRYQPRDLDNDTSVTGWCIMAYESGRQFGLTINENALELSAVWLDQVSDRTGRHGYRALGERSSRKHAGHEARFPVDEGEAMTAVGLFCRFFLHQDPAETPVMNAAAKLIAGKPPVWDESGAAIDHYYWYYATYAMFQVGGQPWRQWQKHLDEAVVKTQLDDETRTNHFGSWDPAGAWGEDGGRVYSTAILALTLQAHYRYTPLLR